MARENRFKTSGNVDLRAITSAVNEKNRKGGHSVTLKTEKQVEDIVARPIIGVGHEAEFEVA